MKGKNHKNEPFLCLKKDVFNYCNMETKVIIIIITKMSELVYEGNLQSKEDFVVAQFLCAQGVSSNCFYKKVGAVAASWSLIWSCAI